MNRRLSMAIAALGLLGAVGQAWGQSKEVVTVSYTHLTLPTKA
mgnify:CR=1 FL=1